MKYRVAEIFQSINGEGKKAGELAVFVRFCGCNLHCDYCDTMWANEPDCAAKIMDADEILKAVQHYPAKNVTLTGGEPLLQEGIEELLWALLQAGFAVEIETNGSVALQDIAPVSQKITFTMDYKLPGSGMEAAMVPENFDCLTERDAVKFVVSDRRDLLRAHEVAGAYLKGKQCAILLSPVFDRIEPAEIVEFMKEYGWTEARLQIQLHKVIWDPQERGV